MGCITIQAFYIEVFLELANYGEIEDRRLREKCENESGDFLYFKLIIGYLIV